MRHLGRPAHLLALLGGVFLGGAGLADTALAQKFSDLKDNNPPLTLKAQGSFYIGGELFFSDQLGPDRTGNSMIGQMYVRYMVPQTVSNVPIVLLHGGGLSGKNYETQPDGRMGWDEYFLRKGSATYVVDQAGRARSSNDISLFNKVRTGAEPPSKLPVMQRTSNETAWTLFRFGPKPGEPFAITQFPVEALNEFAKQQVTTLNAMLPQPDPNFKALAELGNDLKGAVIVSHSQSGRFPLEAALIDASGIRGIVAIEPAGGCNATTYTDQQIAKLAKTPILIVFGDHLDAIAIWKSSYNDCLAFVEKLKKAGGKASMLYPPELGIFGNSHMLMNDKNSDAIADLILKWMKETLG